MALEGERRDHHTEGLAILALHRVGAPAETERMAHTSRLPSTLTAQLHIKTHSPHVSTGGLQADMAAVLEGRVCGGKNGLLSGGENREGHQLHHSRL